MTNLAEILKEEVHGASFVGLCTRTPVKLPSGKKNPLQGRVFKQSCDINGMVFQNKGLHGYEEMVKRRLTLEGKDSSSFSLKSRPWGTRLPNLPIVEHDGRYYLEVIVLHEGKCTYSVDGREVDPDSLGIPEKTSSKHNLENEVIIRTYAVDHILTITIGNRTYTNLTVDMD